jgi:SAM-dependent methyltransferase
MAMDKSEQRRLKRFAHLAGNGAILDIGFAQNPNPYLKNVVGADIRGPKPRNYKSIHLVNLNSKPLPFKPKSFDAVIAGGVIEHVENPSHVLRECNRVLKDDGMLIVSTPQAHYYWSYLHTILRRWIRDRDEGAHLSNWGILDFTRLLKKNGFDCFKLYGDVLTIPKLPVKIPVGPFPMLSWDVTYVCRKVSSPDRTIHTIVDEKYTRLRVKHN